MGNMVEVFMHDGVLQKKVDNILFLFINYIIYFGTCFKYFSTSPLDPNTIELLSCIPFGKISKILSPLMVTAEPPACSINKAMGKHSYNTLNFNVG